MLARPLHPLLQSLKAGFSRTKDTLVYSIAIRALSHRSSSSIGAAATGMAFPIPRTISPEAQAWLRQMGPAISRPAFSGDWAAERKRVAALNAEPSSKAKELYVAKVDTEEIAGVPVVCVTPRSYQDRLKDKLAIYIHGGGYVQTRPQEMLHNFAPMAQLLGIRVAAIDFGLAPERPFPGGIDDCHAVYSALLHKHQPQDLLLWGDSSGGAMTLALLQKAAASKLPLPAAVVLYSPWADIDLSKGDSYATLQAVEPFLDPCFLQQSAEAYLGAEKDRLLQDPLVSPVYGNYSADFPPTLIVVGTREIFLSNCFRQYRVLKAAGVAVQLSAWEGMWHTFQNQLTMPEAVAVREEVAAFFRQYM